MTNTADLKMPPPMDALFGYLTLNDVSSVVSRHNSELFERDASFSACSIRAQDYMARESAVAEVYFISLRGNGHWEAVRFKADGSHDTLWNFTTGERGSVIA